VKAPFRLYGHRGAAAHHPENTRRSFRAALEAGADAVETDVRLCRDGRVVVFHDATGARTCRQGARLREVSSAEVCRWDAGGGEPVLRLEELLEELPSVFVNVDVKDCADDAAQAVLDVVRRCGAEDRVGLASFSDLTIRTLRRLGWRGQLGLGPGAVTAIRLLPSSLARWLVPGDAAQIPPSTRGVRLDDPALIERWHRMGLRVDYWTIDDPAEAVRLVRAGADGIVSNDPGAVRRALDAAGLPAGRGGEREVARP
jgi:glycerophosphoryl diester phosphodiesterase